MSQCLFYAQKLLKITGMNNAYTLKYLAKQTSKSHACFKLKIEHENLCRNNEKTPLRKPVPYQQHGRVVSKCSVWW